MNDPRTTTQIRMDQMDRGWAYTLNQVVEMIEDIHEHEWKENGVKRVPLMLFWDVLYYLRQYRDARQILVDDRVMSYWGRTPVIEIDGMHFAVRDYVARRKAWRCLHVEFSPITGDWTCEDDENYIISNDGKILYKEVGWRLEEVPYEPIGAKVHKA